MMSCHRFEDSEACEEPRTYNNEVYRILVFGVDEA